MACEIWKCKTCKKTFERPVGGLITAIRRLKKLGFSVKSVSSMGSGKKLRVIKTVKMIACPSCGNDSLFEGVQKNGK